MGYRRPAGAKQGMWLHVAGVSAYCGLLVAVCISDPCIELHQLSGEYELAQGVHRALPPFRERKTRERFQISVGFCSFRLNSDLSLCRNRALAPQPRRRASTPLPPDD